MRQARGGRLAARAGVEPGFAASGDALRPGRRDRRSGRRAAGGPRVARRRPGVCNTWYGGELVVENRTVTPLLEEALSNRTATRRPRTARCMRTGTVGAAPPPPGVQVHRQRHPHGVARHPALSRARGDRPARVRGGWPGACRHGLCFVSVIERHGKSGARRRTGSSRISACATARWPAAWARFAQPHRRRHERADMQVAVAAIRTAQGGVCVVRGGQVRAMVDLPIAGLLSDKRAAAVAAETTASNKPGRARLHAALHGL